MARVSTGFQCFCLCCCIFTSACLQFTSPGPLENGTDVNLTCIHNPYLGVHIWTVGLVEVLSCIPGTCDKNPLNDVRFDFKNNLANGKFVFTIKPVLLSDNGSVIGCDDGNSKVEHILQVIVTGASDGFGVNCKCITVVVTVVAVAWASAVLLNVIGTGIYKHFSGTVDLLECCHKIATLPWIFLLVVVLLYRGPKKEGPITPLFFFVVDGAFIVIVTCLCRYMEICKMLDLLLASLVYLIVCALASALKYIIVNMCCNKIDSSNPRPTAVTLSDKEADKPGTRRTLPRLPSVSSRLGNEKEYENSINSLKRAHRPLPPIVRKEKG